MKELIIETERLLLYPLGDEAMRQLINAEKDETMKQAYCEMLQGCIEKPEDRVWYSMWNIELKEKAGVVVGSFCFKGASKNGMVEIGYGLRNEFCGNGYMTETVKAISDWAFTKENVSIIEAETSDGNQKSKNVLLRAGFQFSGIIGEEGPRFQLVKNSYC